MNPADKCRLLADAIIACFSKGITIDSRTQHYMDACLPELSMEEVALGISDTPDLDAASLMDLVFFPDEALQIRLEPLLEAEMYGPEDEAMVVELLAAETIETTLRSPKDRNAVPLRVPSSFLGAFVRRLNISRHVPPGPAAAITHLYAPEAATRLKVVLRNARIDLAGPAADFLEAFILGMGSGAEGFDDCFTLTLELLGELGAERDPFRLLRLKADEFHRAANAARLFEEQLRRSNMETLMHQGVRAPEISAAVAERKISLLDRIGRAAALGGCEVRRRKTDESPAGGQFEPENGPLLP
jgi:hypothetical protein